MSITPQHPLPRFLLPFTFSASLFAAGCQFFFPMPTEPEVSLDAPTRAVRITSTAPPFLEGEVLQAQVFVEDVSAGNLTLRVGKKCTADGKMALPVSAKGHLGGVLSVLGSGDASTGALIDLDASLPLEAKWDLAIDDRRTFMELDYASGRYRLHQLREEPDKQPANSYKRVDLATEQTPHDGHSLLGYLRRWEPPANTNGFLYAVIGRYLVRADVSFAGKEVIRTGLGQRDAVRIDGVATRMVERTLEPSPRHRARPFTMWLSDDDARVPLRVVVNTELAELTVDLSSYTKEAVSSAPPEPCASRVDKAALAKARKPRKPKHHKKGTDSKPVASADDGAPSLVSD